MYDYDRRRVASGELTSTDFVKLLESKVKIGDKVLDTDNHNQFDNSYSTVYVSFFNVPKAKATGATGMNNRFQFKVEGFGKGQDDPPPRGKVKVEATSRANAFANHKLRAKSGNPAAIATYLADFINKVSEEVEPRG
jgi:hypothetical protein